MLTKDDFKWHCPVPEILQWLAAAIPPDAKVLDIGPGLYPFKRADVFVDCTDRFEDVPREKLVICDISKRDLPFADKSFDFIYCRQVLEDLYDPFRLCSEMSRVGKAGYVETPSPIAELCIGVDGNSPNYRGYHHHRYFAWVDDENHQLNFVTKYPFVELLDVNAEFLSNLLKSGSKYWNTYFPWIDGINVRHLENGPDFVFWPDYPKILNAAVHQSKEATDYICTRLENDLKTKVSH